ncbi:MAG: OadG family protein [Clostridia bacterium]|nr:OadG family protein [Clostridia bacterium]MBR2878320.1 OadG family protein [Clostridia bacterium]MBR2973362.1 OadG family protein [Clostridia bacterium]
MANYIPSWFVIVLGLATVFAGLIVLIFVCKIMSFFCMKFGRKASAPAPAAAAAPASTAVPKNPELAAAIGAAIAEDLGEDVSAIRIKSIKKI